MEDNIQEKLEILYKTIKSALVMHIKNEEKCEIYKTIKSAIIMAIKNNEKVKTEHLERYLAEVQKDIYSKTEELQELAIDVFKLLLTVSYEYVYTNIYKILAKGANSTNAKLVHKIIMESVAADIKHKFSTSNFIHFMKILEMENVTRSVELMEEIKNICVHVISKEKRKTLLLNHVVVIMMAPNTETKYRQVLVDLAFNLIENVLLTDLSNSETKSFLNKVNNYIKNISEIRSNGGDENWHKLWIFLVKFLGKCLHGSLELTNKLLRVVEFAFRDSSYQQRLKGYDCWKVLIENASLDPKYLNSAKQIKLLLTPLKAKFSKQEIVIIKRFEVFAYLMNKLQQNSNLVLLEFLEFCFGPLEDSKDNSKSGQAKTVPDIWLKSAKVLIALMGHTHSQNETCISTDDILEFEKPVINCNTFPSFQNNVIIKSVIESSILLKDVALDNRKNVLQCMWRSLFSIISELTDQVIQAKSIQFITSTMEKYLGENQEYTNELMTIIFSSVMHNTDEIDKIERNVFLQKMVHPLAIVYFTLLNDVDHNEEKTLFEQLVFNKSPKCENIIPQVLDVFCKLETDDAKKIKQYAIYWISLINKMDEGTFDNHVGFLSWPIQRLNNFADYIDIDDKYRLLMATKCAEKDFPMNKFVRELEKILSNNPLICKNILIVLKMLDLSKITTLETINIILRMFSSIVVIPSADEECDHIHSVAQLLKVLFLENTQFSTIDNEETVKMICTCVKHILRDKDYVILTAFKTFLCSLPTDIKPKYQKYISLDLLMDLFEEESDKSTAAEIYNIIENLYVKDTIQEKIEKKTSPQVISGRSAKIASLVQSSPRNYQKNKNLNNLKGLLFEKMNHDNDKLQTPTKVKGSMLNSSPVSNVTPTGRARKNTSSPLATKKPLSLDDESSSAFVKIDTEVKIQKDKLTENQKEALKKRREDIPALYQDLSQSSSQDLFSEKSSSVEAVRTKALDQNIFKLPKDKKIDQGPEVAGTNKNSGAAKESEKKLIIPLQKHKEHINKNDDSVKEKTLTEHVSPDTEDTSTATEAISSNDNVAEINQNKPIVSKETDLDETLLDKSQMNASRPNQKLDCPSENKEQNSPTLTDFNDNKKERKPILGNSTEKEPENAKAEKSLDAKKRKIELELRKLSMDIVGADQFQSTDRRKREKRRTIGGTVDKKESSIAESSRRSMSALPVDEETNIKEDILSLKHAKEDSSPPKESGSVKSETKPEHDSEQNLPTKESSHNIKQDKVSRKRDSKVSQNDTQSEYDVSQVVTKKGRKPRTSKHVLLDHNELNASKVKEAKNIPEDSKKRKRSCTDEESEDIIESSQETTINITPVINLSSTKRKKQKSEESIEQTRTSKPRRLSPVASENVCADNSIQHENPLPKKKDTEKEHTDTSSNSYATPIAKKFRNKQSKEKCETKNNSSSESKNRLIAASTTSEQTHCSSDIDKEMPTKPNGKDANLETLYQSIEGIIKSATKMDTLTSENMDVTIDTPKTLQESSQKASFNEQLKKIVGVSNTSTPVKDNHTMQKIALSSDAFAVKDSSSITGVVSSAKMINNSAKNIEPTQEQLTVEQTPCAHSTQSQETETQTDEHNISPSEIQLQLDIPQKPVLTDSEKEVCEADTLTQGAFSNDTITNNSTANLRVVVSDIVNKLGDFDDISPVKKSEQNTASAMPVIIRKRSSHSKSSLSLVRSEVIQNARNTSPIRREESILKDSVETPEKKSSLPGSPITCETPNRTHELLNDTVDISPISSKSNSEENLNKHVEEMLNFNTDTAELEKLKEYVLKTTPVKSRSSPMKSMLEKREAKVLPLSFSPPKPSDGLTETLENPQDKNKVIFKHIISSPKTTNRVETDRNTEPSVIKSTQNITSRASRLFELTNKSGSPLPQQRLYIKKKNVMSPSTSRIKKLMSNYHPEAPEEALVGISNHDILTFSREIPSPLAVPRTSILKRKLEETCVDEGMSPCAKRKRVNFSDPCTTSKKVFIKEQNEFDNYFEPNLPTPQYLRDLFDPPEEESEKLTDTEPIETEESLQVINPLILRKDKPIFPNLIDCTDDVSIILNKVTSPMFVKHLLNKLKGKNIKTIGDLARQSEAEISRLPFKVPVVANVHKTLENYYNKCYVNKPKATDNQEDEAEPQKTVTSLTKFKLETNVTKEEKKQNNIVIDKSKDVDTTKAVIPVKVDKSTVRSHGENSNTTTVSTADELKRILANKTEAEEEEFHQLVFKRIVDTKGLPQIFEILTKTIESPNDEATYFDCMLKHCIDTKPLSILLEKRQTEEIRIALSQCIDKGMINKQELFDSCFIPLISNPFEIKTYFELLTIVDISDIVINRLHNEEAKYFIKKIVDHFGSENVLELKKIQQKPPAPKSETEMIAEITAFLTSKSSMDQGRLLRAILRPLSSSTKFEIVVDLIRPKFEC